MDAHDDLANLFRQVGAIRDSYREFAVAELPTALPADPPAPAVVIDTVPARVRPIDAARHLPALASAGLA
ncbi:hypothetical protein [Sphaerotilus mobilis]|uniref:Uncharacterized protein n=1 Tax=Sphaerotilus mobilis TaxID=47994 RepID=A0A4Q7LJP1_9BURK|nr:hypothetical protein [Sphaerotilus mobilis]RZS54564.1 hypothetical protein EV685_2041 [Sphaerotilus mobilis]